MKLLWAWFTMSTNMRATDMIHLTRLLLTFKCIVWARMSNTISHKLFHTRPHCHSIISCKYETGQLSHFKPKLHSIWRRPGDACWGSSLWMLIYLRWCHGNWNLVNTKCFPSDGCHNTAEQVNVSFVPKLCIFSRDASKNKLHICWWKKTPFGHSEEKVFAQQRQKRALNKERG